MCAKSLKNESKGLCTYNHRQAGCGLSALLVFAFLNRLLGGGAERRGAGEPGLGAGGGIVSSRVLFLLATPIHLKLHHASYGIPAQSSFPKGSTVLATKHF